MSVYWTSHSKMKMREHGISKTKIRKVVSSPNRKEKGVAPDTVAVMKKASDLEKKKTGRKGIGEIWVMYQDINDKQKGQKRKIIAAWRYPGKTPVGEEIPIPDDIKKIIKNNKK